MRFFIVYSQTISQATRAFILKVTSIHVYMNDMIHDYSSAGKCAIPG